MDEFRKDLNVLINKLQENSDEGTVKKLNMLKDRLIGLRRDNIVKISHSVMELICARHLIIHGYDVEVERLLDGLSCDLYCVKGLGTLIVEIETGFIPPEHALDPLTYCRARIASKITRYSGFAHKFCLGTPPHYIMQIPQALTKPSRYRTEEEVQGIKKLCDIYYSNPYVSIEEIKNARIHAIFILDVDKATVKETEPEGYTEKASWWSY